MQLILVSIFPRFGTHDTLQAQGLPQEFTRMSGDRNDRGWSLQRLNNGYSPRLPSEKPFGAMFVREATQSSGRRKHCIGKTFGVRAIQLYNACHHGAREVRGF